MSLLEARGIHKRFGPFVALEHVDLTVEARQFHGVIGPNGSGKSTLLKCLVGAEDVTRGTIALAGKRIEKLDPAERARSGMSLKFQIVSIIAQLSVFDNVLLAVQAHDSFLSLLGSRTRRKSAARVDALLASFRLTRYADVTAGTLSHGHQQWLEIAMALASEPRLLLLDEPTAGMSIEERRLTGELLRPLKEHCSVLIVEHDLDFIRGICDVLTVLHQGEVLDSGTVAHIQSSRKVQEVYLAHV
ncbi:ABC transporter ATP-binding protein [Pararobbsia alpina]|uniref:Sulfate/thiosulfate import ATP-binding protein CysA n=1 Tax=Pararobbsia alpina TaxID=621374 RepID=A0A6S7BFM9_9BURK|nr:ABC transporter ATP-binding protein [Pararobbsia alpina]CAB3797022.1 Sulfate/thiosulfate import ATP-binding protein CysA [Pararobbsia alpina]